MTTEQTPKVNIEQEDTLEQSLGQTSLPSSSGNVLAVFVVQFDVHKGNVIEWQYPQDFDLEGIEYQAVCSGLHRLDSDVIYFSRGDVYGISVFKNVRIETDRGAHMKAIGIIVQPTASTGICGQPWMHRDFLKRELSHHMVNTETIEQERYDTMRAYYRQYQYQQDRQETEPLKHKSTPEANHHSVNFNLKHHVTKGLFKGEDFGEHAFSDFVNNFGPDIFVLWKASLLRKRIMLINTPPMESTCKYVYNIHLLGKVPAQFRHNKGEMIPKFSVGVNDIPLLEKRNQNYVACTPDSIFEIKSDLYDLVVKLPTPSFNHSIKGSNKTQTIALSDLSSNQPQFKSKVISTKHNPADFTRFRIMWKQLLSSSSTSWANFVASEPNDVFGTTSALMTGIYYWLYEDSSDISASSRFFSSWQNMFAGSQRRRRGSAHSATPLFLNEATGTDNDILMDEDDQDALEINNNQVFEAVNLRRSAEINDEQDVEDEDVAIKEDNEFLLGFFHTLTHYLLHTLQTILSINEEEGCPVIHLYPKDIVQLGLDPRADVDFITEIAFIYFRKRIQVNALHNPQACLSLCCCQHRQSGGSIRL